MEKSHLHVRDHCLKSVQFSVVHIFTRKANQCYLKTHQNNNGDDDDNADSGQILTMMCANEANPRFVE